VNIQDVVAWAILLCVAFYVFQTHARQDYQTYILVYGEYGSRHGGIQLPQDRPRGEIVPQDRLCAEFGRPDDCVLKGMYKDGRILLSDQLDFTDTHDLSVLAHELTHFLQESHRGPIPKGDTAEWCRREMEAHHIQYTLLMKAKEFVAAARVRFNARQLACRGNDGQN
jgi:hypothetical protein